MNPIDTTWNSGPPPSLGWWPASYGQRDGVYRWWDGKCWSEPALKEWNSEVAAFYAICKKEPASWNDTIQWQERPTTWPARSMT